MKAGSLFLWLVLLVAALLTWTLRQRSLNALHAANASLHQQLAAASPPSAPAPVSTPAVAGLTPQEQNELLHLRGQIQPLRRELAGLSNQLSAPLSAKAPTAARGLAGPNAAAQKAHREAFEAFSRAQTQAGAAALGQALAKYLAQNGRQLPTELAQLQSIAPDLPTNVFQSFELMRSGEVSSAEQSYSFVARTKAPEQLSDGRWGRAYLRADGVMLCGARDAADGWAEWETIVQSRAREKLLVGTKHN